MMQAAFDGKNTPHNYNSILHYFGAQFITLNCFYSFQSLSAHANMTRIIG